MCSMKLCSKCRKTLTLDNFSKNKDHQDGLRSECKECGKIHSKIFRDNNKEKLAKYAKEYRVLNLDKETERNSKYYKENTDKVRMSSEKYRVGHLDICNVRRQRYRTRKQSLISTMTEEQWKNAKQHFDNKCCYCGKERPLAQEHFYPMSLGGEYATLNIVCSCQSCNSSKGAKTFSEWYKKQPYYSKKRENKILSYLKYKNNIQQLSFM